jgi:hypothetical protein
MYIIMQQPSMKWVSYGLPLENQAHIAQIQQELSEEQQTMDLAICKSYEE